MANKASLILTVDWSTERVTRRLADGTRQTDRFVYLTKVDRLATLKFAGHRWQGKPGLHATEDEILSAWRGIVSAKQGVPTPPKEDPIKEEVPTPKVSEDKEVNVTAKATKATEGGTLEKALADILAGVVGESLTEVRAEVASLREALAKVQPKVTELHLPSGEVKRIEGIQHMVFPTVLMGIQEAEPLWLVGPAGTGKSTLAEQAAEALGLEFSAKSCSSQTTETTLLGYMNATGGYVTTEFRKRYETGGVFLLDEVDNGNPNVLTVLNSALSNGFMAFPDGMVRRHKDFVLVATANTFGNGATADYVGRNPIDKAFLDRFSFITVGIDPLVEEAMLNSIIGLPTAVSTKWLATVRKARENVATYGLKVVISPRATVKGAKWLRNGVAFTEVIAMTLTKGLHEDQATKVLEGVKF